jgi:hypothetical protein
MKILISGSTGFVGSRLVPFLEKKGHEVFHLVFKNQGLNNEILWNPELAFIEKNKIPTDLNAVINLAGENISEGKWTQDKKLRILNSRINSTKLIVDTIKEMNINPEIWINASASGFYGNTKKHLNTEEDSFGDAYLSEVCRKWEAEAFKAQDIFKRVIILRFGVILDKQGGALKKMLPVFKLGLGGKLGCGRQYFPWVALDEVVEIINFALNKDISGIFNTTSPPIITNQQFTKALSIALKRPAVLLVPEVALKLLFGQMAEETMLMSTRVSSGKLVNAGYKFKYSDITEFLIGSFNA